MERGHARALASPFPRQPGRGRGWSADRRESPPGALADRAGLGCSGSALFNPLLNSPVSKKRGEGQLLSLVHAARRLGARLRHWDTALSLEAVQLLIGTLLRVKHPGMGSSSRKT